MSIEMMTLVWHHSKNKGNVLLMELAIADHAHSDGTGAYPSVERLTIYARGSERNAQYILQKLQASKEIIIHRGKGPRGTHLFEINITQLQKQPDLIQTRGAKFAPAKIAPPQKLHRGVQNRANHRVQNRANHRVQPVAPKPEPEERTVKKNRQYARPPARPRRKISRADFTEHEWKRMLPSNQEAILRGEVYE